MAHIDLPQEFLERIGYVLQQLQQTLPEVKTEVDFSAPAYKWQKQQLKPIAQPKKCIWKI
jgi:uncharacterized protein YdhG (YjbR/CyaY superfamily)